MKKGLPDNVLQAHGYRVIAHDRRGHGRSTQTALGHDMDTYAANDLMLDREMLQNVTKRAGGQRS